MASLSPSTDQEKYTFFFRSESPFSQWHPAKFTFEGVEYNCAEQFMMHKKAFLFGDEVIAEKIMKTSSPKEQKRLGRQVKNFDDQIWNRKCREIVMDGNLAKFSQNSHLKEELLRSSGTVLVEASPFDRIWGIGLSAGNPKAKRKATWRGKNLLGYILTEVRDEISKGETKNDDEKKQMMEVIPEPISD